MEIPAPPKIRSNDTEGYHEQGNGQPCWRSEGKLMRVSDKYLSEAETEVK